MTAGPSVKSRRSPQTPPCAAGPVAAFLLAAFSLVAWAETPPPDAARLARRVALVAELLDEGAAREALMEARRLKKESFWKPDALNAISMRLENAERFAEKGDSASRSVPTPKTGFSPGAAFARAVVSFYRFAVSPGIGSRCALEPSCSQYFLIASRKHGLLGLPMIADRFVREPVVSAPDRPVILNQSGQPRHPDPVEDHDGWFSK